MTQSQDIEVKLAEVRYEGLKRVNPAFLESRDNIKVGDKVDSTALSRRRSACRRCEISIPWAIASMANPKLPSHLVAAREELGA